MITYEIQTQKKHVASKDWEIGSVFEDRELALHEAKIMDASDRYAGIRVVAEDHNPSTGKTESSMIFRGGSNFKVTKAKIAEGTMTPRSREPAPKAEFVPRTRTGPIEEKRSVMSLVPMLLLFLVIGLGGMYALHELVPD